tara:strand:- start:14 stop:583 length:570 start_codon:yes stop_codon:yes gene_type:complete
MKKNRILVNEIITLNGVNPLVINIFLILFGTLILTISSKIQVPFWPVPMTMQTFVVFLIGMTYSMRLSFFTLIAYLFEGAMGLPVFAAGGGLVYLTGPTAGYLYGMTLAVVLISYLADKGFGYSYVKTILTLLIGSVIIFSLGIIYLGSIIGYSKAIQAGLIPFIPSEIFKIGLAVAIIPTIQRFIKKI